MDAYAAEGAKGNHSAIQEDKMEIAGFMQGDCKWLSWVWGKEGKPHRHDRESVCASGCCVEPGELSARAHRWCVWESLGEKSANSADDRKGCRKHAFAAVVLYHFY